MSIFPSYFFFSILCILARWRWIVSEKWCNRSLRLLNMLFPGRIYIARGPWHLWDFCNIFLPNISEDQKKSYYLSAGLWHWAIWQIRRWLVHYVRKKFRWGPEVATFRTKTYDITLVIRLNWLEKTELRGCVGPPSRQYYLLLITVVRVCCCTQRCWKKLKMKKQGFFVKFLSLVAFQLRGPGPPEPPSRLRLWFWDKIAPLKFLIKKYIYLKQNWTNFFFQNVEDSSQVTWQFFETSWNCMTLLWRGQVVVIIIAYFCTRKS